MRPIEGLGTDEVAELRELLARLSGRAARLALTMEALLAGALSPAPRRGQPPPAP